MTINTFIAGNVAKIPYVFTPETGAVALADVTARLRKANGTEVVLTGITTSGTNTFRVDWVSGDADITGRYVVRWESNAPSPKIVDEVAFNLVASVFATP